MKAAPNLTPPGQRCGAADPFDQRPKPGQPHGPLARYTHKSLCLKLCLLFLISLPMVIGLNAGGATSVYAQTVIPADNPDLSAICSLNIVLVLDESGSLVPYRESVQASVRSLLEALANTGSGVAIVEFNDDARLPLPNGTAYHPVTTGPNGTLSPGGIFDTYLNHGYIPNGYTNWDAAFVAVDRINRISGATPLVIFVTDDQPNVYSTPFGLPERGGAQQVLDEAVASANLVKAAGSHIFVVGVGSIELEAPIIAVSGPDRYPDLEPVFGRADYVRTNFDQLTSALREIVFGICGPSVTVTKHIVQDGTDQLIAGQPFTGTVRINEAGVPADSFVWLDPVEENTPSRPITTGANGTAQWQWAPGTPGFTQAWRSEFTLDEALQPGYIFERATCSRKTLTLNGGFTSSTFALPTLPATIAVGPDDLLTCDVYNARLALAMQKQATPATVPESGAPVTFDFALFNNGTSTVTLESLVDNHFGNLAGQGSCLGNGNITLGAGLAYRCAITATIAGNRGTPHVNTATATVRVADGTIRTVAANATVTFRDALPQGQISRTVTPKVLDEPGGVVVHSVTVTNTNGGEPLLITQLANQPFGDVTSVSGPIQSTTCTVPQSLAPVGVGSGGVGSNVYRCEFRVAVSGNPGPFTDTLTVHTRDDEGNVLPLTDIQSVQIRNLLPAVSFQVDLVPETINEPGGLIQQRATITNRMTVETLFVTALDSSLGTLGDGLQSTCRLPQTLAPGATYQCNYSAQVQQNAGDYSVVMTATVTDDDGSVIRPVQSKELIIGDVPSAIEVTVNADRSTLAEPGDDVTFTVAIRNTSPVDAVTIQRVTDDTFGDLAGYCISPLPATLLPNEMLRCDFVGAVGGAVGSLQSNEVTAAGVDDDGKPVSDSDQESIEITDVPAQLAISQVAQPANIPEPGGVVTLTTVIRNISLTDNVVINTVETNEVALVAVPGTQMRAAHAQSAGLIDISATCTPALPFELPPNGTITCQFNKTVSGPIRQRHISTVIVSGIDDELIPLQQNSREAVDIIDVPSSIRVTESSRPVSVPEAGALVTFTVQIHNTSRVDAVTLNTLQNDRFGDLSDSCPVALPTTLDPGDILTCTFTRFVTGDVDSLLRQQTTVTAIDDDGQPLGDSSQSTIGVTDTPSSLKVIQLTNPTGITEPGGTVTFTAIIENNSAVDGVTIQSVHDSNINDISLLCVPQVPTTLAPGEQVRCQFSRLITGNANMTEESTITVLGIDDDGVTVTDFDLVQVDLLDVMPISTLIATATPNELLETGGTISMSINIVNQGPELTTLTVLSNTLVGDLNGIGSCQLPQELAAGGGSYRCAYETFVTGSAGSPPANVVYALAVDDEGNAVMVLDEVDLFLVAVAPDLQQTKTDELLIDLFEDPGDEGKVSPGDTLQYTIEIRNEGNGAAENVILEDRPDPNTRLLTGTVTTTRGSVLTGNRMDDEIVTVLLGDLGIGETATVQFNVLIVPGTGTTLLRNQAFLSHTPLNNPGGTSVSGSDDPNTEFLGDPTDTVVFVPPTNLEPIAEPAPKAHSLFLPMIQR